MEYDNDGKQRRIMGECLDFSGKRILEIGCGDGSLSVQLARNAGTYTAIDPDRDRIRQARLLGGNVDFRTGTGEALEFPDASFDLVLFTLSLHHQNSPTALDEAFRVLVSGGHAMILEPDADGAFQQLFHLFDDETRALTAAQSAIRDSRFRVVRHQAFSVDAVFKDKNDLVSYHFDRPRILAEDGPRILDLVSGLKGRDTIQDKNFPLLLRDGLHLFLLEKPPA